MSDTHSRTEALLARVSEQDDQAVAELIALHRSRIRRMVAVRLDRRLAARVDPSDVVQETMVDAVRKLPEYAQKRPVAFYPWLREIAMNRLIDMHRQHLTAQRRSVRREQVLPLGELNDESQLQLAHRLVHSGTSPSRRLERKEQQMSVQAALKQLSPDDREVLVLKYLEELSATEIAAVLNVSERTVWRRHSRAIEQLGDVLGGENT